MGRLLWQKHEAANITTVAKQEVLQMCIGSYPRKKARDLFLPDVLDDLDILNDEHLDDLGHVIR